MISLALTPLLISLVPMPVLDFRCERGYLPIHQLWLLRRKKNLYISSEFDFSMNGHKESESSINQFATRIRARHTLEEHNKNLQKNRFENFTSETFIKRSFWRFETHNPSGKNRFDYLTFKILQKKIVLKVMTFAHVYQ